MCDVRPGQRPFISGAALLLALATAGCGSRMVQVSGTVTLDDGTPLTKGLVVFEGMTPTLAGIAVGAVAALGSSRLLEKLVFGVSASDPVTLAAVAGTLAIVALMASLVPAYRASRLDPSEVLRTT